MLPAFPNIQSFRRTVNEKTIRRRAASMTPMGLTAHHINFEGSGNVIYRQDASVGDEPLQEMSAKLEANILPLEDFNQDYLDKQFTSAAEQMATQMNAYFFKTMDKVTAETGNVVRGDGKKLPDVMLLEMYEKMDHSFRGDGTWERPTMIGPGVAAAMTQLEQKSPEEKMEFLKKLTKILEKKRDEYFRREADRVLVG